LTTLLCDLYLKTSEVSFLRWGRYTNLCIFTLPFTNAVVILKQTFLCKFYMLTIQCGVVCNDNKTQSLTSGCSTDKVSMLSSFSFSIRPSRPTCSILTAVILLQNTNGKRTVVHIFLSAEIILHFCYTILICFLVTEKYAVYEKALAIFFPKNTS